MPIRWQVVNGRSTREARPEEEPLIKAFVGSFVGRTGKEPLGVHDVEGLEEPVWFITVHN